MKAKTESKSQKTENVISAIISSLICAVGVMIGLIYLIDFNFSPFIGVSLAIVGFLTAHRSVIAEMTFKKYKGPDVIGGLAVFSLGVTLTNQAMLGVVVGCFPIFAGVIGLWFLLDGTLALLVHKKKDWIRLILGVISTGIAIWLFADKNFGKINCLLLGVALIGYAGYFAYSEFWAKDRDIEVIKVQEDYD